jgi:hypothetical protein
MHNQHTDLSQTLAEQHRTELREQATHPRPLPPARPPRHQPAWSPRRWWQLLTRRPSSQASQPPARITPIDR